MERCCWSLVTDRGRDLKLGRGDGLQMLTNTLFPSRLLFPSSFPPPVPPSARGVDGRVGDQ